MKCNNCGTEINDGVQFCPECGNAQNTEIINQPVPTTSSSAKSDKPVRMRTKLSIWSFILSLTVIGFVAAIPMAIVDLAKFKGKKHGLSIAALIISGVVLTLAIIGNANSNTTSNTYETPSSNSSTSVESTVANNVETIIPNKQTIADDTEKPKITYGIGESVTADKVIIKYVSAEYYTPDSSWSAPEDGNKIIKATFDFENKSKYDEFVSYLDFKCYADNIACDYYHWGDNQLSATISSGRQTVGSVYFEVPENAESIELEYEVSFWSNKKVTFIVK